MQINTYKHRHVHIYLCSLTSIHRSTHACTPIYLHMLQTAYSNLKGTFSHYSLLSCLFYAIYFVAPLYIDYTIKHIIEHRISCTEEDMLIIALMCFYTNVNLQYLENVFKSIYTQPLFSTDK